MQVNLYDKHHPNIQCKSRETTQNTDILILSTTYVKTPSHLTSKKWCTNISTFHFSLNKGAEKNNSRKTLPLKVDPELSSDMTVTLSTRVHSRAGDTLINHRTHSTRTPASTPFQHTHLSSQRVNLDPRLHTAIKNNK